MSHAAPQYGNTVQAIRLPRRLSGVQARRSLMVSREIPDQLAVLNRDEKTPLALSASFTLQAVRLASRLICVALRLVFSVL